MVPKVLKVLKVLQARLVPLVTMEMSVQQVPRVLKGPRVLQVKLEKVELWGVQGIVERRDQRARLVKLEREEPLVPQVRLVKLEKQGMSEHLEIPVPKVQ